MLLFKSSLLLMTGIASRLAATLNGDRGGFATADAQCGNADPEIAFLQRMQQSYDQARAACADGVTQRARPAIDVNLAVIEAKVLHGSHRDDRKCFIDLVEINVGGRKPSFFCSASIARYWRGGKPFRLLCKAAVPKYARQRRETAVHALRLAHHYQRGRAIGNRRRAGGSDGTAITPECRAQRRDFVDVAIEWFFVLLDHLFAFARCDQSQAQSRQQKRRT